jgi:hypothetical protein
MYSGGQLKILIQINDALGGRCPIGNCKYDCLPEIAALAMIPRTTLTLLLLILAFAALPLGEANAQSKSGKSGPERGYWCCFPMPPHRWAPEPMGPMFRSRILRQLTFMQGRIPKYYTRLKNPLAPTAESIGSGRVLYGKLCETCHGSKGLGSGETAKGLAPSPALLAFMIKLPESVDPYLVSCEEFIRH